MTSRQPELQHRPSARIVIVGFRNFSRTLAMLLSRAGAMEPSIAVPAFGPAVGRSDGDLEPVIWLEHEPRYSGTPQHSMVREECTDSSVAALMSQAAAVVTCVGRAQNPLNMWINSASLHYGIPALYLDVQRDSAEIGPVVIPGRTCCYLCWRLRTLACERDYRAVLDREALQAAEQLRRPAADNSLLSSAVAVRAARLVWALVRGWKRSQRAWGMVRFTEAGLRIAAQPVLPRPDCPACAGASLAAWPSIVDETRGLSNPDVLAKARRLLVHPRFGIIRSLRVVPMSEPCGQLRYQARAILANSRFAHSGHFGEICLGRGTTAVETCVSVVGEAVERYSSACWRPETLVTARYSDLVPHALDPRELVLYLPHQYQHLQYAPFTTSTVLDWVSVQSCNGAATVFVPAEFVFAGPTPGESRAVLVQRTSSGIAAGSTQLQARLNALLEVLERDALMLTWMNRLPPRRVDARSLPYEDVQSLLERFKKGGTEFVLARLITDHPAEVFLAVGITPHVPRICAGLGADLCGCMAARKAMLEMMQVREELRRRLRSVATRARAREIAANPRRVHSPEDHALLYAMDGSEAAIRFLREAPLARIPWEPAAPVDPQAGLGLLERHLQESGREVYYYDLTPDDIAATGLHAVRALVPGLQPIHFGYSRPRLGGERLYTFARERGLARVDFRFDRINLHPHPLG